MYAVTAEFLAALNGDHVICTRVTTTGGVTLSAIDGSVTMDSRRGIERACGIEFGPTADLSVQEVYELLMVPTTEVVVERGIVVNGVEEYVALGTFSTDTAEVDKATAGCVKWDGSDRSKTIARARFTDPYVVAAGTTLAAAGTALLTDRFPPAVTDFTSASETLGAKLVLAAGADSDPWKEAQAMFADHGYYVRFSGAGVAVALQIPDPSLTAPVFSFGAGETNLILGAELKGTLEQTYNGVVASGEGSDVVEAVRAEVWDEDPTSPTYVGTGLRIPYFYSSPLLTTSAMCLQAATTMLAKVKGRTEQLSWPAIANPALEPLDVITISVGDVTSTCVIDSLTIPLKASSAMSAVARETRRSF